MRVQLPNLAALVAFLAILGVPVCSYGSSLYERGERPSGPGRIDLRDYYLPDHYRQLIQDRAIIDRYQLRYYQVEDSPLPAPVNLKPKLAAAPASIRVIASQLDERTLAYRAELPGKFIPLRGFRAPILESATNQPPAVLFWDQLTEAELQAADLVNRRLAPDGLLSTLAQIVYVIGPQPFLTNGTAALEKLGWIGFPTDLLVCFPPTNAAPATPKLPGILGKLARRIAEGATPESLLPELREVPFRPPAAWAQFRVATESGAVPLQMLRLQFGGGYRDGVVPGDGLDVIHQLVAALPQLEFVVSVPREFSQPFQSLVLHNWGLPASARLTIIEEPFGVAMWAQDNGKPGWLAGENRRATLTPRYASMEEGVSALLPGESFLMDGLAAAGVRVIHFPLLFQGGNLLAVVEPATRERLLLLSESDLHRNTALGLSREQVLAVFQAGFGVDRCVVLPAVSYHLDFDVSVRDVAGRLVAFVNDPIAAARIILRLGVEAMAGHGYFEADAGAEVVRDLREGPGRVAFGQIERALSKARQPDGRYAAGLAKLFVNRPLDSAAGNLQCFVQAFDLLAASLGAVEPSADGERQQFLAALSHLEAARRRQLAEFEKLKLRVVAIPSMPNLFRSINYLNGIQHSQGFLLPVFGGFYAPLDHAAETVLRGVLPADLAITRIQCAELQRNHGGVHCAAVGYTETW